MDQPTSLCLLGRISHRGPPPIGGDSPKSLRGAALYLYCSVSVPHDTPGGDLPAQLADDAIQEGREDGWFVVPWIGLLGVEFLHPDCESWLLKMEEDRPLNVFSTYKGLLPMMTGRDLPFKEALNWMQFAYTVDQEGAYVVPAYTVLS